MAELDLDALEQAAREAGGGCWLSAGWTVGSRGFEVGDLKSRDRICSDATERCAEFIAAANPATILELLNRLKAAEKSDAESLAMYRKARDERDALRAALRHEADCVEAAKAEIEALRAKIECLRARIEEMEKQESVATVIKEGDSRYWMSERLWTFPDGKYPLYALPGAQPALSVPDGWRLVPIVSTHEMKEAGACAGAVYYAIAKDVWSAMLAAAPEAKL